MKTTLMSAVAVVALSAAAWAQSDLDTNGDGMLTLDEVQAAYPDVTAEDFSAMDTNADGALSDDEVKAAIDAGQMPASEG